jgi:hypothetical protein
MGREGLWVNKGSESLMMEIIVLLFCLYLILDALEMLLPWCPVCDLGARTREGGKDRGG